MDESRRAALEAELADALSQKQQLDVVISYLEGKLGIEGSVPQPPGAAAAPPVLQGGSSPSSLVSEGEFFGLSGPKAAVVVLERAGKSRPLKTEDLFEAIKKGGAGVGSSGALYRSLFRDPKFTRVGKSLWGLSAWYPPGAVKKAQQEQGDLDGGADTADAEEPQDSESVPPLEATA